MCPNNIDHFVIGTSNLISGTRILENILKSRFSSGGEHKIMATHNNLLKLQSNFYLEIIANNQKADTPSRRRWFSLDEKIIKEKIYKSPRLLCWVLKVDNIEEAVKKCGYYPGEIIELSRDDLEWKVTIPFNGKLIENGVLPILIEWKNNKHPTKKLSKSKVSIYKLSLFHPEPKKIKKIINNLVNSEFIEISKGIPKIELSLSTQNGIVIIN